MLDKSDPFRALLTAHQVLERPCWRGITRTGTEWKNSGSGSRKPKRRPKRLLPSNSGLLHGSRRWFPTHREREIEKIRGRLHNEVINLRRLAEQQELVRLLDVLFNDLRDRQKNPNGYRSREADDAEDAYLAQRKRMTGLAGSVPNPTALQVVH